MEVKAGYSRLKALLELLSIDLSSAYRFPMAELYAALYAFFLIVSAIPHIGGIGGMTIFLIYLYFSTVLPKFITNILMAKNIAFGFAGEVEKGLMQTYLTYPLKRLDIFIVKILTCILIPFTYFTLTLLLASYLLYPEVFNLYGFQLLLLILSVTGPCILFGAIVVAASLLIKRGGASLGMGVALYFAIAILEIAMLYFAGTTRRYEYQVALFILEPLFAFASHFGGSLLPFIHLPTLTFEESAVYLIAHYAISIGVLAAVALHFIRRFEPT
ncbi:MAG: hypothetical protein NDF55_00675 [archaeon GB-1867-005]|nr:hypothetical protein [Candidatus Culexmicrobium cathedralense]